MRRVLVAPDSFKGAISARRAGEAMARGLLRAGEWEVDLMPLADGGEGTLEVVGGGRLESVIVHGPYGALREAHLLWRGEEVWIESAQSCGLAPLGDPRKASSAGVGELIMKALSRRPSRVRVCLGGTLSIDGGRGALEHLGARFYGEDGPLAEGPLALQRLKRVDLRPALHCLEGVELEALCDVEATLLGARGASLYMAQKGAKGALAEAFTQGLERLSEAFVEATGDEGIGWRGGGGAAGGLGAGLLALGACACSGAAEVFFALGARERVGAADWVFSGEGRVDSQTSQGKVVQALARLTRSEGRSLVVIAGELGSDLEGLHREGVSALFSLSPGPRSVPEALEAVEEDLERVSEQIGRLWGAAQVGVA